MLKYFTLIVLLGILSTQTYSQQIDSSVYRGDYSIRIDSIVITGNKITNPDVILRELTFSSKDTVNKKIILYNQDRIFSLGIFTRVNLIPVRQDSLNFLYIIVDESWYIYPLPFAQIVDKDWGKISYGFYLFIRNFRGENETLYATAAFGYDPFLNISYNRPYLFRSQNIYFNMQLSYQNSVNKSQFAEQLYGSSFKQKFINGLVSFAKRIGIYNKINVDFGYEYVESPTNIIGITASGQRIDHQFSIAAGYQLDTRDLAQFPSSGYYILTNFSFNGLGYDGINYHILNLDFRDYKKIFNNLIIKWRIASRITFGKIVPYYDYSFFGYGQRIRGYFSQKFEGNDSYLSSLEINYPVLKNMDMSLKFIPLIPKSLLSFRFGIYGELFGDAGAVRQSGQNLSFNDFNPGYGGGLIFLFLPYNILRLEYAFNPYHHSEVIADIGISF